MKMKSMKNIKIMIKRKRMTKRKKRILKKLKIRKKIYNILTIIFTKKNKIVINKRKEQMRINKLHNYKILLDNNNNNKLIFCLYKKNHVQLKFQIKTIVLITINKYNLIEVNNKM